MSLTRDLAVYANMARTAPRLLPNSSWTLTRVLEDRARTHGRCLALAYLDRRYTWREVDAEANRWARLFQHEGIVRGDVVALMMDNRPEYLFAVHGLGKLGAAAALINTNLSEGPLVHAVGISGARKVLAGDEHAAAIFDVRGELQALDTDRAVLIHLENASQPRTSGGIVVNEALDSMPRRALATTHRGSIQDLYCYIYTSGTTGLPKAAVITHFRALGAGWLMAHLMMMSRPGDVIYVPLPLYHSSAMFLGWCAALTSGASVALRRKFSASAFWDDVRKFRASHFVYIGELCRYLLNAPPKPNDREHGLRVAVGNGLRPDIWEEFQRRFGIPHIREFYGATEGTVALINREGRPGMIGKLRADAAVVRCDPESGEPLHDAAGHCQRVSVGETGLLLGRIGLLGFDGYIDEKASQEKLLRGVFRRSDTWFNTGDLVQLHEGNWLSFADRVGDTFRWKGENVSTNEVAEVCNGALGVLESNVYGVAVPGHDGRAGMAALSVGAEFDLDAFARHVAAHLAKYQRPLFLRLLAGGMQTTGTFKHQKVAYRAEGFDPAKTTDELRYFDGTVYRPIDEAVFAAIERGELKLG
jgi:acyl-CoA synthetase (AMP-forming)/AMP-acid ligase II